MPRSTKLRRLSPQEAWRLVLVRASESYLPPLDKQTAQHRAVLKAVVQPLPKRILNSVLVTRSIEL